MLYGEETWRKYCRLPFWEEENRIVNGKKKLIFEFIVWLNCRKSDRVIRRFFEEVHKFAVSDESHFTKSRGKSIMNDRKSGASFSTSHPQNETSVEEDFKSAVRGISAEREGGAKST